MTRPLEHEYESHYMYARALEKYATYLEAVINQIRKKK